jgi:hypothetical protein
LENVERFPVAVSKLIEEWQLVYDVDSAAG